MHNRGNVDSVCTRVVHHLLKMARFAIVRGALSHHKCMCMEVLRVYTHGPSKSQLPSSWPSSCSLRNRPNIPKPDDRGGGGEERKRKGNEMRRDASHKSNTGRALSNAAIQTTRQQLNLHNNTPSIIRTWFKISSTQTTLSNKLSILFVTRSHMQPFFQPRSTSCSSTHCQRYVVQSSSYF